MIVTPEGIIVGNKKLMMLNWKWLAFAADSVFHLQGVGMEYQMTHDNHSISLKWDCSDEKAPFKGFEERMLWIFVDDMLGPIANEFFIDLSSIKE